MHMWVKKSLEFQLKNFKYIYFNAFISLYKIPEHA